MPNAGLLWLVLPLFGLTLVMHSPVRLGMALGGVFLAAVALLPDSSGELIWRERNLYGVLKVTQEGGQRRMVHGDTLHGRSAWPSEACQPLAYYHPDGPLGLALEAWKRPVKAKVAVVGLGAGALACFAKADESWTFFEINPAVIKAALAPDLMGVLGRAPVKTSIVEGDARLSLARRPDVRVDLLVLDAFHSDAIPLHLLTTEAFAMYRQRLSPDGVIALNISNRHVDLRPMVAKLAKAQGMQAWSLTDVPDAQAQETGRTPSRWVLIHVGESARMDAAALGFTRLQEGAGEVWTDGRASLLDVL